MADVMNLDDNAGGYWGSASDLLPKNSFLAGDQYTPPAPSPGGYGPQAPVGVTQGDGGTGKFYQTPGYTPPAPGPNASAPRPSVNPSAIYTDTAGNAYDAPALAAAYNAGTLPGGSINSRVPDLLAQYGLGPQQQAKPATPASYQGTSVFSDPATSSYEQLLNGLIGRLNTPYTPPGWNDTMTALKSYIDKLNGPAYTPDQMDLFNTQAIDPIMAQRDADEQAIIRRFAAQGMGPSSGPVQAAILANRQKYGGAADQARAQIAAQGVNTQKNQQAQAMGYQLQIPTLETNLNTYNNQNGIEAANLAGIIPNMAWNRLQGAQGAVGSGNPLGALSLLNGFQTQGYNQGADYASSIMQIIPYLLKIAGLKIPGIS